MTLAEWAINWPYKVRGDKDTIWTPDAAGPAYEAYRALAWSLSDHQVSSISGGTIWFIPREPAQ